MLDRLLGNLRFAIGLAGFLGKTTSFDAARDELLTQIPRREAAFLELAERAIYANPKSPYRRLLDHAGITFADLRKLIAENGLDGTLERLYDAGVYVSYEEVRGRKPIRRGDLEFTAMVSDFDNPLLTAFREMRTAGTRSEGTRVFMDLEMLRQESSHMACLFTAHGVAGRPVGIWRPIPPASAGLNNALRYTKVGMKPEVWFSQDRFHLGGGGWRGASFLIYATLISYLVRRPFPWPKFVPQDQALTVARWMAAKTKAGTPAILDSSMSGATRVCLAAREHGLDISGSYFRVGGEPLTETKAEIVRSVGGRVLDRYSMVETTAIALGCADPVEVDDMHVLTEKLAVLQRDKVIGAAGETVPALVYTTLQPSCQMVMLNAESGDYGKLVERQCGCFLGSLGYTTHLSGVRGYDKLTSEGITFMGSELYRLVDEVLPSRFGGHATDYQLVEEEVGGIPKVSVIVAPRVGEIDEAAVVLALLGELRKYYTAGAQMTAQWQQSNTLQIIRREPYVTGGRKILPLHILKATEKPGTE